MGENQESATRMLLYRTNFETWQRGEQYANTTKIKVITVNEREIIATVSGTSIYETALTFRSGGLSRKCSCPVRDLCKHIVALAILWDKSRGIKSPTKTEVKNLTIHPPLISRTDINKAYNDPLNADLETLRLASSESGHWSRPHAHLPSAPRLIKNKDKISYRTVKQALLEIKNWSHRGNFDPYFCAGEMVAAFCELIRYIKINFLKIPKVDLERISSTLKDFEKNLIMELIDDSDGLHLFTETHLKNLSYAQCDYEEAWQNTAGEDILKDLGPISEEEVKYYENL